MNTPIHPSHYENRSKTRLERKQEEKKNRIFLLILIAGVLFVAFCHYVIEPHFIDPLLPTAEAHELAAPATDGEEEIHQNDYYCKQIADGLMRVDPAQVSANDLLALCAPYL